MTATASIICTIWIAGSHWAKIFSSLSCLPIGFRGDYIILRMTSREVVMVPWCPCVAYCDAWLAPSNGTISLSTVTVRSESRRKAVSLVTKSAHPFNNAVAPWSASGVLRFIVALRLAAFSSTVCVMGNICTSGECRSTVRNVAAVVASPTLSGLTSTSRRVSSLVTTVNCQCLRLARVCRESLDRDQSAQYCR